MIIELIGLFAAFGGTEVVGKLMNGRFPRPTYAALVGWWWGSFAEDSPGILLASMIDSDLNCDAWRIEPDYYYDEYERIRYDQLFSDSYHARISYHPKKGRCKLFLEDKSGMWHEHKTTAYEDYVLNEAKNAWKKRKVNNEASRIAKEHMDLVNERITQNYMDTLTMIEQRILHSDTTVTDPNLRAMLPPSDQPVPTGGGGGKEPEYELVKGTDLGHETTYVKKKTKKKSEFHDLVMY